MSLQIAADLSAFAQVVFIDLSLAGDNAVVVGMVVAGLPRGEQRQAIVLGIAGATVLRIVLGALTLQVLDIIGLTLAGGVLLLWVCWRMYRAMRAAWDDDSVAVRPQKTWRQAMLLIVLTDVSMSVDNVLAVAGAARGRPWILAAGLVLSVMMTGVAAGIIARVLERVRWLDWLGLLLVLVTALRMIWDGSHQVAAAM